MGCVFEKSTCRSCSVPNFTDLNPLAKGYNFVNGRNFGPLLSYMPKVYSSLSFFMFVFSQINRNTINAFFG